MVRTLLGIKSPPLAMTEDDFGTQIMVKARSEALLSVPIRQISVIRVLLVKPCHLVPRRAFKREKCSH